MTDQWQGPVIKMRLNEGACFPVAKTEFLTIDLEAGTYQIAGKDIDGVQYLSVRRVKPPQ